MRETLKRLRDALRPIYGNGETEAIIRIIFHYLKGWNTVDMLVHESEGLSPFVKGEVEKIIARLLKREPIQYITGEAWFHGLILNVTPDVLIPRPETSELVDIIADRSGDRADLRVLDVCTGSGCIAIALSRSLKFARVDAIDVSQPALNVARENAEYLKTKIRFIEGDVFSWCPVGEYDIIVSNPPYIGESEKRDMEDNVLKYEPASALFVPDSNPLMFYKRIAEIASTSLTGGGRLYFEINPRHSVALREYLAGKGFADIEVMKDSCGKDRFMTATLRREDAWQ